MREFAWVFLGPGLVSESSFPDRIETDLAMRERLLPFAECLRELDTQPELLNRFLAEHPSGGRLGRHFENLLHYYLLKLACVDQLVMNLQVRDGKRTMGELDLVFRERAGESARHWEASVKFYICITDSDEESKLTSYFMGTLVEDRLDRKIRKLFNRQLTLPQTPQAASRLNELGLVAPQSRALLKGFFFYPSHTNWRARALPPEVSASHTRGWWTTEALSVIPQKDLDSRYIVLPFSRWFAPFSGLSAPHELFTLSELRARLARVFDNSWARPVHYEMMVAEVVIVDETNEGTWIRERSRGTILHAKWPTHARESLLVRDIGPHYP